MWCVLLLVHFRVMYACESGPFECIWVLDYGCEDVRFVPLNGGSGVRSRAWVYLGGRSSVEYLCSRVLVILICCLVGVATLCPYILGKTDMRGSYLCRFEC